MSGKSSDRSSICSTKISIAEDYKCTIELKNNLKDENNNLKQVAYGCFDPSRYS